MSTYQNKLWLLFVTLDYKVKEDDIIDLEQIMLIILIKLFTILFAVRKQHLQMCNAIRKN